MGSAQSREPDDPNHSNNRRQRPSSSSSSRDNNPRPCKRRRSESSTTTTMNNNNNDDDENENDDELAGLQNDLERVEQGLNERRGILFSGFGGNANSNSGGGGRGLFDSIGTALGNIRDRLQTLTGSNASNSNTSSSNNEEETAAPATPGLNESLRVLSQRLETAERSHSTRVPLAVLQSELSRRDLNDATAAALNESGSSAISWNDSFVSSPGGRGRRRSSALMASRTRDDPESSSTTLSSSRRSLLADDVNDVSGRSLKGLAVLPEDTEDSSSYLLLPESARKSLGEEPRSILRASTRGSLKVLSEDLVDRFAALDEEEEEENNKDDDDSGDGMYAWGVLEFRSGDDTSQQAYRFFGTNHMDHPSEQQQQPQRIPSETRLGRSTILSMSVSETHCAFATSSGRLLVCGNNRNGAVDPSQRDVPVIARPIHLEAGLAMHRVKKVSCGTNHTAVVTDTRSVLTWGSNHEGQLGHFRAKRSSKAFVVPKAFAVGGKRAVDVACYKGYTIVLTTRMEVFSAGGVVDNNDDDECFPVPQQNAALRGLPLVGIAAGDTHAVAWTAHGTAYAWGSNDFGQCGRAAPKLLGIPVPVAVPNTHLQPYTASSSVPVLPNWNVWEKGEPIGLANDVHIVDASCGKHHTVFVTDSGRLLVCGSNAHGQLGLKKEATTCCHKVQALVHPDPKRNFESVQTGNHHTLVFDDHGDAWQTGNGQTTLQKVVVSSSSSSSSMKTRRRPIVAIAAGGTTNFCVTRGDDKMTRRMSSSVSVSSMPGVDDLMDAIRLDDGTLRTESQPFVDDLARWTEELFRSPAVVNSLFMDPKEIDNMYETLLFGDHHADIKQRLVSSIEKGMRIGLTSMEGESRLMHFESVRFLLLYLQCPLWRDLDQNQNDDNNNKKEPKLLFDVRGDLLFLLCETILALPFEGYKAFLACAVALYGKELFVPFLVKPLVHQLNKRLVKSITHGVPLIACVLTWLSNLNDRSDFTLARLEDFHCSGIEDMPMEALFEDLHAYHTASDRQKSTNFFLAAHPFLMTVSVKQQLLRVENQMSMVEAAQAEGVSFDQTTREFKFQPYFVLAIDRNHLLPQTLQAVAKASTSELRKGLKVVFKGEDGVDAGGVTKEFFQLLCEKLFDVNTGMWTTSETTHETWFNPDCTWNGEGFYLVGVLCGLAVYNSVILDVHFPHAIYRKLLSLPLGLEDVIDADVRRGLKSLLDYEGDDVEQVFCLNFEIFWMEFGHEKKKELKEGGSDIAVTSENKEEYVMLYVKWLLLDSVAEQYDEFERGFHQVMADSSLDILTAEELELLVTGTQELDFFELEKSCKYEGGFDAESAVVRNIWKWVQSASLPLQEKFLKFCTGSKKGPIGGLGQMPFMIQRAGPDSCQLPTSHTCFNTLIVQDYGDDYEKLSERLGRAIIECEGFGLQ